MKSLDFTGREVDEALRVYQTCFRLPVSVYPYISLLLVEFSFAYKLIKKSLVTEKTEHLEAAATLT